jgi:hypothetical protein
MTESPISTYLAAWDALRHELAQLAGAAIVLGEKVRFLDGTPADLGDESHRIGSALASALEVIDRLADDAADTAVINLAEVAEFSHETRDDE